MTGIVGEGLVGEGRGESLSADKLDINNGGTKVLGDDLGELLPLGEFEVVILGELFPEVLFLGELGTDVEEDGVGCSMDALWYK